MKPDPSASTLLPSPPNALAPDACAHTFFERKLTRLVLYGNVGLATCSGLETRKLLGTPARGAYSRSIHSRCVFNSLSEISTKLSTQIYLLSDLLNDTACDLGFAMACQGNGTSSACGGTVNALGRTDNQNSLFCHKRKPVEIIE
jgi:hypothetical protein